MLKGIPSVLQPELLKILMEMGHGDEIVIADGNFPGAGIAKKLVRCDGNGVVEILEAVLRFFPLDSFVKAPVTLMAVVQGDDYVPHIQQRYREIIDKNGGAGIELLERFAFYERAKNAYAVITTGETARYANIILKKGVV